MNGVQAVNSVATPIALHASAVHAQGRALMFLGPSGAGKSTVAEMLSSVISYISSDATYLIPRDRDRWFVSDANPPPDAAPVALSEETTHVSFRPLLYAVVRLHQARSTRLARIDCLETCRYLTDAFFEVRQQRHNSIQGKREAFQELATVARCVAGYDLQFTLGPRTLTVLNNEFNLW